MKIIKRLLIFLLVIIVIIGGLGIFAINRIKAEVTSEDLPQDVYESDGDFQTLMAAKALEIVGSSEEDSYTLIEEFLNLLILDIIRNDVNSDYDPLNGETADSKYIINHEQFTLDYIYAHLNDDNQIIVTVSLKRNNFPKAMTAFHFVFDIDTEIEYNVLNIPIDWTMTLSLSEVYLHDILVKQNIYDYFVSMANKDDIEAYVDKGELDLDDYTYTISFLDLVG
ncbi:MAG: hypothetical protein AB7E16_01265 [Candidatus Izemoplasmatales bacterium]